jgi:hypothetical protein
MNGEAWFMVYDGSGNAVSMGTVVANPLPEGLSLTVLTTEASDSLLDGTGRWDAATHSVVPVTPPPPEFATRWQVRKAMMLRYSIRPEDVETFIVATVPDTAPQALALIDWRDSPEVRRDHPLIGPFVNYLSQVRQETIDADEFFRYANTLER